MGCSNYEFALNINGLTRDHNHLPVLTGFLKLPEPELTGLHRIADYAARAR